jgi:hypothetical protein
MRAVGSDDHIDVGVALAAFVFGGTTTGKLVESATRFLAFGLHLMVVLLDEFAEQLLVLGLIVVDLAAALEVL